MSKGTIPHTAYQIENTSGEDIPPRSVVLVTGVETSTDRRSTWSKVTKYNGDPGNIMVTGPITIAKKAIIDGALVNGRGTAFFDQFVYVTIAAGETPEAGDEYGPEDGKWTIGSGGTGFVAQGAKLVDSDPPRCQFYRPGGSGSGIKHAIPRYCLGQGMYLVEIATYYPETPIDDGSGPFSGSGLGSGSTGDIFAKAYCGACFTYGDTTHGGYLIGDGELHLAVDVGRIPLVTTLEEGSVRGAHCLISKVADTEGIDANASGSGSGSGESAGVKPYMILNGTRHMTKIPHETWACCIDPITDEATLQIVSSFNVLVEGIRCDEFENPCPS